MVDILNKEINMALKDPAMIAKLKAGRHTGSRIGRRFGKIIADETASGKRWSTPADLSIN